ncbi:MAG: PVC-type heme-binding CxxCH protein [Verrucomicrobiota bacterium]
MPKHPRLLRSTPFGLLLIALSGFFMETGHSATESPEARFVRISLPKGGILTLAEVEIYSQGKNIAPQGKTSQSSVGSNGVPERAIDGNKDGDYGRNGQTHTNEGRKKDPWWEIDLGKELPIEGIQIWNRDGFQERLNHFKIEALNDSRKPVFMRENNTPPRHVIRFDLNEGGKIRYLTRDGKPGQAHIAIAANSGRLRWSRAVHPFPPDHRDPEKFEFQSGDVVAIFGNALAERLQYDGWLETLVQNHHKDKRLRFRNMAISGDRVDHFPRNRGFTPQDAYLEHVDADVVLAFFGYNESFDNNPQAYRQKLEVLIQGIRATRPGGELPRIVLFSPIAHEDIGNPNLPDGKENNLRLAAYTEATREAAESASVTYVDLFTPSQALYAANDAPLTINGIHLNELGNRLMAEVIAHALTDSDLSVRSGLEPVREAVLEKNLEWFDRYRAVNGNDVWGSRSGLKYTNGQSNAEVLKHELVMLDVITANRDELVWARAKGGNHVVKDDNVPSPIPVVTNVKGTEEQLRYLSSEESLATMAVPKDFQIEVFADEQQFPELVNPVQMQVDAKGRLWAAVWPTYPKQQPIRDINDALLIFKDTDRDGRADKVVKFAEVPNPLGFEFWNGGVIVSAQPNLLFLRDTDGDDIADERYVLLHGLGSADSHHAANNLIYGPCGGIYWQSGIFLHNNFEHPWGPSLSTGHSGQYRFDPRRFTVATHGRHGSNPHGISFDAWGYHFITDGTGGNAVQVHPHGNGWGTRNLLRKEVRPVPANSILSSTHFPEEMQQDFLICNAIGFLGIKQYRFDYGGTPGSKRKEGEVWGEPSGEELTVTMDGREVKSAGLLLSGDRNFRPTDAVFGEDGALYVSDWANVIIGHMQHNVRDPKRDYQHGRIFRISHKTRPLQEPVAIAGASLEQLMKNLEHPVDGVRHRTRIELSSRDTKEVIAACRTWMKQFDPKKAEHARHLLEALWLHQAHNVRNTELLTAMIQSPEPRARVAAQTVQHHWFAADPTGGKGVTREEVVEVEEEKKSGIISDSSELTEIRIGTIVEKLSYDVTKLTIKSGKKIRLTFDNTDHMPHNLVVTQPGASQEIGLAAAAMGAEGFARDFLPDSDKIIAATKMLDGGTEETIEFTAPTQPGAYEIVCTFPGHFMVMKGVLEVK